MTSSPPPAFTSEVTATIFFTGPLTTPLPPCPSHRSSNMPQRAVADTARCHTTLVYRHRVPIRSAPSTIPMLGRLCSMADGDGAASVLVPLCGGEGKGEGGSIALPEMVAVLKKAVRMRFTATTATRDANCHDDDKEHWLVTPSTATGSLSPPKTGRNANIEWKRTEDTNASSDHVAGGCSPKRRFVVGPCSDDPMMSLQQEEGGGHYGRRRGPRWVVDRLGQLLRESQYTIAVTYFRQWYLLAAWRYHHQHQGRVAGSVPSWAEVNVSPLDECDGPGDEQQAHRDGSLDQTWNDGELTASLFDAHLSGRHVDRRQGSPFSFFVKWAGAATAALLPVVATPDDMSVVPKSPSAPKETASNEEDEAVLFASFWGSNNGLDSPVRKVKIRFFHADL